MQFTPKYLLCLKNEAIQALPTYSTPDIKKYQQFHHRKVDCKRRWIILFPYPSTFVLTWEEGQQIQLLVAKIYCLVQHVTKVVKRQLLRYNSCLVLK